MYSVGKTMRGANECYKQMSMLVCCF